MSIVTVLYMLVRLMIKDKNKAGKNRLNENGSVVLTLILLVLASLEGIPGAYRFSTGADASVTLQVKATPQQVWNALETATSPDYPIPDLLRAIPKPIAVILYEGTSLNAKRVVQFVGREGSGLLELQVVERTTNKVIYKVTNDSSPIAGWVSHRSLTYGVEKTAFGVNLTVSLKFDRNLSPAWFFNPFIRYAGVSAVTVLAKDVRERSIGA